MASRDEYTDAGRMGAPSRGKAQVMKDAIDMDANTMTECQKNGGWMTKDMPVPDQPIDPDYPSQY